MSANYRPFPISFRLVLCTIKPRLSFANVHRYRGKPFSTSEYTEPKVSHRDKIFIAMSSGVDSSIAAALLIRSGHPLENLQPFYMANWSPSASPPSIVPPRLPYNKPKVKNPAPQTQSHQNKEPKKCTEREFNDVREVCQSLGLNEPLYMNFEKEYWNEVFIPMIETFQRGQTPNPDVECNRQIKFGVVLNRLEKEFRKGHQRALDTKAKKWWMATGHYAHVLYHTPTNKFHLTRSCDPNKDQTFYLSTILPSALPHLLFPLGSHGFTKPAAKTLARELSLPGWRAGEPERQESMGLCFVEPGRIGKSGFRRWLREYLDPEPGKVVIGPSRKYPVGNDTNSSDVTLEGMVIGKHQGLWHATIGERSHLEFPQGDVRFLGKWYVSRKNREQNTLEVVKGLDNTRLFGRGMIVERWRWLGDDAKEVALKIRNSSDSSKTSEDAIWEEGLVAQFRHRQKPLRIISVEILENPSPFGEPSESQTQRLRILFSTPERSVTPGQSAALWFGKRCLGGGVIEDTIDLD